MQPILIAGYNQGGLIRDRKPFLLPNQAFSRLENAVVWRDAVIRRRSLKLIGRLQRCPTNLAQTATQAGATYDDSDLLSSVRATEPNAEISIGNVTVIFDFGNPDETEYNDSTTPGILTYVSGTYTGSGTINYITGAVHIDWSVQPGAAIAVRANACYYPSLPSQGITTREVSGVNDEAYIFYDTKYAYVYTTQFLEYLPATNTTWAATDHDFFWYTNYRGTDPQDRLYFVTDFVNDAANPMRYTNGSTWNNFSPQIGSGPTYLTQARILIPYYGRLLALNVWEGSTQYGPGTANIFNRCRFSQIGNPIDTDSWRSDIFGRGGFIDAPTNEAIVSATFIKNTLLVEFERSTWQLRYVGEYGLPFIWERVSSDFGCDSTFSTVLFDDSVLAIGDKAIVAANANTVQRIDEQNPDTVFEIQNRNFGTERVHGVRDFFKEMVYWCYPDSTISGTASHELKFPNRVLVYNYRTQTYAEFDDRVTCFGAFQTDTNITWDSLVTFWDDEETFWDNDPDQQSRFPIVAAGNQQGYIHQYNENTVESPSLSISGIDTTVSPNVITVINHNLENTFSDATGIQPNDEGYTVKITGALWSGVDPDVNNKIYGVVRDSVDTLKLYVWSVTNQMYEPTQIADPAAGTYIGGGQLTVFPQLFIQSKDFNPFIDQQINIKLIYADFLTDYAPRGEVAVELYMNTSYNVKGNLITGQKTFENYLPAPYYPQGSDLAWHRLYATTQGQFVRVCVTMNDDQMSNQDILNSNFRLNAMTLWIRPGGKTVFG